MIKIIISGICGRMGNRILNLALQDKDFVIAGALETSELANEKKEFCGIKIFSEIVQIINSADVLIEFTNPQATLEHLRCAIQHKKAMVIGTTGWTEDQKREIEVASKAIPIVFSPNMSIGANLLFKISEEVATDLGSDYEVEIVEAHHSQKKDAPSGTAKSLAEYIKKSGRKEVKIHSVRVGDIVGDHTVIFAGKGERIELTHRAHSRDAFAQGALKAAKFIVNKRAGLYNMQDVK